jgi:hypothetical protein
MSTSTGNSFAGYDAQRWEARVQEQAREECARLIEHRLEEVVQAARAGATELQRALHHLVSEVRSGVVSGSHRARLPLLQVYGDTAPTANGAGHLREEEKES